MQHNTWGKDRDDLSSLASKVITEGYEGAESGGTVYIVQSDAEYEDTQVHGIFTDIETAKEYAAEVELPTGFWVGVKEMPLNKPEAQGKYHRLS
jgi:anaerobic ribonucleoside-triphosphate reductase